jgi:hypothetical protein
MLRRKCAIVGFDIMLPCRWTQTVQKKALPLYSGLNFYSGTPTGMRDV